MAEGLRRAKAALRRLAPHDAVRFVHRNRTRARQAQQRRFDRREGVDTAGMIYPDEMHVSEATVVDGHPYEASTRDTMRRMIRSLGLDLESYVFLDIGSGKGAALLYATEFPFRRVVGVEYERELHEVALRNLEQYRPKARRCGEATSWCGDALAFELPLEPTVLYLCNPFEGPTLERFLARVEQSLRDHPRPMHVLAFNPGMEPPLRATGWLRQTGRGWSHSTWTSTLPSDTSA